MSSVDDRIVNMQFNNKQFLTGATESQRALEGLDKTLANTGNSKGMAALGSSVDQVSTRFGALQVAGVTALATIVSHATTAGLNLAKSLTVAPIFDGFREYETNLKSVQTIMANTGEKIGTVNTYLNDLNHYSDQTIYNFSQMADSIGKFTAAGVKLPAATDAIKGMANTAALTGANTVQLNSAMYQMSQALASGTIKLMDWNSLVNANMGTQNMQKALMATNRTLDDNGELMEGALEQYGTFRDSLQSGWLTAETFTKTMKVMAGQTIENKKDLKALGMTQKEFEKSGKRMGDTVAFTVEQLQKMGYTKEAAKDLHRLSAASIESATKIKTFTQLIDVVKESVGSGFAQIFQNLFGNLKEAGKLWTTVGNAVTGAIGTIFDSVNGMLLGWKELGGYTALWNGFGNIFKALGNLIQPFVEAFKVLLPSTGQAGEGLANASKGFESFTAGLEKLTRGASALTPILITIAKAVKTAFGMIGEAIGIVKMGVGAVAGTADIGINIVRGILSGFSGVGGELLSAVTGLAQSIIDALKSALGIHSPAQEMVPIGINIIEGIIVGLLKATSFLLSAIMQLGPWLVDAFASVGSFFGAAIQQLFGGMDALDVASLLNAILAAGVFLAAKKALDNAGFLADLGKGLSDFLDSMGKSLENFTKALGTQARAELIRAYAIAIGVLAAALLVLSFLDADQLGKSLGAIGIMLTLLVGSLYALSKIDSEMNIMAIGLSILLISTALLTLSAAVAILGRQDLQTLGKGLGAIAIMLGILVAALYGLSKIQGSIEGMAGSILIIAIAMNALALAVLAFGSMDLKTLAKGLGAIAYGLAIMVAALLGMDQIKGSVEGLAGSILIMSIAMIALATAVGMFGSMDLRTLAQGMAGLAYGMAIMVAALMVMSANSAGVLAAGGAMLMMAAAMNMLVGVILILGTAPWETVAKGLGFVAAALAIFLLAGLGAMYVAPGLLALGISLGLIGAALFLAGAGMLAFGTGFALLAAAGVAGVTILVAAFNAFIALLPAIAVQMAAAFVSFLEAIAAATPRIREAMGKIFANLIGTIRDNIPRIKALIIDLMNAMFDIMENYIGRAGKLFSKLIDTILKVLRKAIPNIARTAMDIALAVLREFEERIPKFTDVAGDIIVAFIQGVSAQQQKIIKAGGQAIVDFLNGIADEIEARSTEIRDAGVRIALAIADGVTGGLLTNGMAMVRDAAYALADALPGWMKKVLGINSPAKEMIPIGIYSGAGVAEGLKMSGKMIAAAAAEAGAAVGSGFSKGIAGSVQQAIAATTAMIHAVLKVGEGDIAQMKMYEQMQIGRADFEQRIADAERRKADRANRAAAREQKERERAEKAAQKAREEQKRLEEKAKKAKKESEAQYKKLMEQAKQAERHADKLREAAKMQRDAAKEQQRAAKQAEKAAKQAQKAAASQRKAAEKATKRREAEEAWASMSAFDRAVSAYNDQLQAQGAYDAASLRLGQLRDQRAALRADGLTKAERKEIKKLNEAIKTTKDGIEKLGTALDLAKKRALSLFKAFIEEEKKLLNKRVTNLQEERKAYEDSVKWQAAYDAANAETQAAMLDARAAEAEAKAAKYNKDADKALAEANKMMDRAANMGPAQADAAKALIAEANGKVDEAEALAQAAMDAADRARDDRKQADELLEKAQEENNKPPDDPESPSGGGGVIAISRSALEDAANVIDRYAASLAAAEEAAMAGQTVVQFNQTNNSPEALTTTEVYRQSKNLLSAAAIKMGVPT